MKMKEMTSPASYLLGVSTGMMEERRIKIGTRLLFSASWKDAKEQGGGGEQPPLAASSNRVP